MSMHSKKKITIYDLSILSGHSPSTVSSVLNGSWRKRRIKEETAEQIQKLAREQQYSTNRQARGLRSSRSGLVGLLLPVYDNRYFSSMAQIFEAHVRNRGQCPIVVSACRDPQKEQQTVETLISYSIDALFIAGATDPDGIHALCDAAGINHINIDLPGNKAHSVISDNNQGARLLTEAIIDHASLDSPLDASDLYLFGGRNDHASEERIRGFSQVMQSTFGMDTVGNIQITGYSPAMTQHAFESFYRHEGRLPRGLFINSSINLEGLMRFMAQHPKNMFDNIVVGCFDYDPFASFLPFPVFMVRQNVDAMITKAFEMIEREKIPPHICLIQPELIAPRTALKGPLDALNDTDVETH